MMAEQQSRPWLSVRATLLTAAVATIGAGGATALHMPAALLAGPALAVSLASLAGQRMEIHPKLRDLAFLVIGIGIGSTLSPETTELMLRWPLAFIVLGALVAAMLVAGALLLRWGFGYDARSAVLASAPGHLSFVIGLSLEEGIDTMRVTVVQAVRLLALTLLVPLVALALGIEIAGNPLAGRAVMSWQAFAVLMLLAGALGAVMLRCGLPAALLLSAMAVSGVAHAAGWIVGGIAPWLGMAGFVTMGALIGTRFSGISFAIFRQSLVAGLAVTALACALAVVAALPVAWLLGLGEATVLAAFSPGGFETMVALGVVLGANPGFVAAAHVARLIYLTALIPVALGRARQAA